MPPLQEQFWRENVGQFEEKDFQVLRVLIKLLEARAEPRTLAVACHDLGQFITYYPAGKGIVTGVWPAAWACVPPSPLGYLCWCLAVCPRRLYLSAASTHRCNRHHILGLRLHCHRLLSTASSHSLLL